MNLLLLPTILLLLFCSCINNADRNSAIDKNSDTTSSQKPFLTSTVFDTTLTPFPDSSYRLTFSNFDSELIPKKNNSIVTFVKVGNKGADLIFQDSFYCMHPEIELLDFNNDGIKDILFFSYSGGRANPTYHLYAVDTTNKRLNYVKGFEQLPNPELDTSNNIITSVALSGSNYRYRFYRINEQSKLVDLGHGFDADLGDSLKYDMAIKQILKQ